MERPSSDDPLRLELDRALGLQRFVRDTLDQCQTDRSARTVISGTLYHLAYEHAASILMLVGSGHRGSGLAMYRPAYDALLRGVWAAYGAKASAIDAINRASYTFPGNNRMSSELEEKAPAELRGLLGAMHRALPEKVRHDLTHGGVLQMMNRFNGAIVGVHLKDEHVIPFIRAASTIMAGSAVGIALLPKCPVDHVEVLATFISAFADNDSQVAAILEKINDEH